MRLLAWITFGSVLLIGGAVYTGLVGPEVKNLQAMPLTKIDWPTDKKTTPYDEQTKECLKVQKDKSFRPDQISCRVVIADMELGMAGDFHRMIIKAKTLEGYSVLLYSSTKHPVTIQFLEFLMNMFNPCDGVTATFTLAKVIEEEKIMIGYPQDIALHRNCYQWNGGKSYIPAGDASALDIFFE